MYGFPFTSDVRQCLVLDFRLYRSASDVPKSSAQDIELARTPLPRVFSSPEELDQAVSALPAFCVTRVPYAFGWFALVTHWRERPPLPCGASLAAVTRRDARTALNLTEAGQVLRTSAAERFTPMDRRHRSLKRLLSGRYPLIQQGLARIGGDAKGNYLELRHYAPATFSAQRSSNRPAPRPLPSPEIHLDEDIRLPEIDAINESVDPYDRARALVSEEGDGRPLHARPSDAA